MSAAPSREGEERYRLLFERSDDAIFVLEAEGEEAGVIRAANPAAAEMYGYAIDELAGAPIAKLILPDVARELPTMLERMLRGEWIRGEMSQVRSDGSVFPARVSAGVIDVCGRREILVFMRDATESQRTVAALREAREAAEAADRAKSAFLANVSHEIRTPLNAILGYTEVLRREAALDPRHRDHLDVIERSGRHLLELINEVLEASKIEAGRGTLHVGSTDLRRLLREVGATFRADAEAKRLMFSVERHADLPRHATVDEARLRQVIVNLTKNAVKFTEQGAVTLRATVRGDREGGPHLVISVEDSGPGIAAEDLPSLFKPFSHAGAGARAAGGAGLGLAVSREHAQVMGGDLTVTSTPGAGATFRLEIPIGLGAPQEPPAAEDAPISKSGEIPAKPSEPELAACALPAALLVDMRRAAAIADYDRLGELIDTIPPELASIAGRLGALLERYDYEGMLTALRE